MQTHLLNPALKWKKAVNARADLPDALPVIMRSISRGGSVPSWMQKKLRSIKDANTEASSVRGFVDMWHGLLTGENLKPIKFKLMSRAEAGKRNESLTGTGFSWARCNPPS